VLNFFDLSQKVIHCVALLFFTICLYQSGEILIVPYTDVGWSPYFPIIGGLATEIGGLLSHGMFSLDIFDSSDGGTTLSLILLHTYVWMSEMFFSSILESFDVGTTLSSILLHTSVSMSEMFFSSILESSDVGTTLSLILQHTPVLLSGLLYS